VLLIQVPRLLAAPPPPVQECSWEAASEALQHKYLKGNKVIDLAEQAP
jgi:hypothetical protein